MPESDLLRYGPEIIVEDLDFSNQMVTFTIEPDDFEIKTTVKKNKKYSAVFSTRTVMFITEPKEYTITAEVKIIHTYLFFGYLAIFYGMNFPTLMSGYFPFHPPTLPSTIRSLVRKLEEICISLAAKFPKILYLIFDSAPRNH